MSEWLELVDAEVIAKGMVITASFRGETDDSLYIWIRRFGNEAYRATLYEAVYESEHWKIVLSPRIGALLHRDASIIQRVVGSATSPMQ